MPGGPPPGSPCPKPPGGPDIGGCDPGGPPNPCGGGGAPNPPPPIGCCCSCGGCCGGGPPPKPGRDAPAAEERQQIARCGLDWCRSTGMEKRFLIKDKYVWGSSSLWKGSQRAIHLCNSQRRMSLAAHKPHDRAFSTNHTIVLLETHPGAWGSRRDAAAAQRRCRPAGRWAMVLFHSASSAQAAASSAARLRFSAHVCQNQLVTMSTFTAVFVPPPPCCCLASVPRLIPQSINDDTAAF